MENNNFIYNSYYNWWKNIDKFILILILLLFFLGLFFSLVSTSIIASDKLNTNSYYFFAKHFIFIILAITIFMFFSYLETKNLIKLCIAGFIISFIFLILVPLIGVEVKGSKRWIDFPIIPRFQPIELLKPFFIVLVSLIISKDEKKNIYFKYLLSFIFFIPIIFFLITQPDIGQAMLIIMTWLSLIFISGVNLLFFYSFFIMVGLALSFIVFYIPKFSYIKIRLISFLEPSSGNNYQSEKASEAIINGGFFGRGIGEGKLNSKIPEAHTDYIVSVISEEFGAVIVIAIILVYLVFAFKVIKKIRDEKNNLNKLILLGSISLILLQTFIHIGVNIRILPTTGMTLPFISYGGSSIIGMAFMSGIILNLTKRRINY